MLINDSDEGSTDRGVEMIVGEEWEEEVVEEFRIFPISPPD